jgi:hypothetical protein
MNYKINSPETNNASQKPKKHLPTTIASRAKYLHRKNALLSFAVFGGFVYSLLSVLMR